MGLSGRQETTLPPDSLGGSAALEFSAAGFYYGPERVLDDLTFRLVPGEMVALVGPSGAGKSTLLMLADGSLTASSGTVRTLGHSLPHLNERRRRSVRADIGIVPQAISLPGSLRVIHNVNAGRLGRWTVLRSLKSLVRPVGRGEVQAALREFGIEELADARTDTLSGGQQQRVALARLLVQQPRLVLADEPVSSVDPAWSGEVLRRLRDLAGAGCTVLVSVHDPMLAREHCDRMIGLRAGVVAFDVPVDDVSDEQLEDLYRIDRSE